MDRVSRLLFVCVMLASASTTYAAQVSDMAPCAPNAPHEVKTLDSLSSSCTWSAATCCWRSPCRCSTAASSSTPSLPHCRPGARSTLPARPSTAAWCAGCASAAKWRCSPSTTTTGRGSLPRCSAAIEAVSLPTVIDVFDVVKEGAGGAPIIDITSLFTTNAPKGFALDFKRHYRMAQVDGRRSLVQSVRAFPQNIADRLLPDLGPRREGSAQTAQGPGPAARRRSGSPSRPISCCCRRSRCCPAARTSGSAISRSRSTTTAPASTAW